MACFCVVFLCCVHAVFAVPGFGKRREGRIVRGDNGGQGGGGMGRYLNLRPRGGGYVNFQRKQAKEKTAISLACCRDFNLL